MGLLDLLFIQTIRNMIMYHIPYTSELSLRATCKVQNQPRTENDILLGSYLLFLVKNGLDLTEHQNKLVLLFPGDSRDSSYCNVFRANIRPMVRHLQKNLRSILTPLDLEQYTLYFRINLPNLEKGVDAEDDDYSHLGTMYQNRSSGGYSQAQQVIRFSMSTCEEVRTINHYEHYQFPRRIPLTKENVDDFDQKHPYYIEYPYLYINS